MLGDERVDLLLGAVVRRPPLRVRAGLGPVAQGLVVQRPLTHGAVGRQGSGWAHVLLLG